MDRVEFKEKLVSINRITKVVKGGRRFTFSALIVVGNYAGSVGIGYAKAKQVPDAIKKATQNAKKNLIKIPLRDGRTLHHDVIAKDGAGKVLLRTAPSGTGIIAGGPIRAACEVLGIKDVVAKSLGSSNPMNVLRACLKALKSQNSPKLIAKTRGKSISEITKNKY
jgi:small subunit ribosomal protein S5